MRTYTKARDSDAGFVSNKRVIADVLMDRVPQVIHRHSEWEVHWQRGDGSQYIFVGVVRSEDAGPSTVCAAAAAAASAAAKSVSVTYRNAAAAMHSRQCSWSSRTSPLLHGRGRGISHPAWSQSSPNARPGGTSCKIAAHRHGQRPPTPRVLRAREEDAVVGYK